jgi:hypothetical protein
MDEAKSLPLEKRRPTYGNLSYCGFFTVLRVRPFWFAFKMGWLSFGSPIGGVSLSIGLLRKSYCSFGFLFPSVFCQFSGLHRCRRSMGQCGLS